MTRVVSYGGRVLLGLAWMGAVIGVSYLGLSGSGEPPWVLMAIGIAAVSLVLGRLTGAFAMLMPVAVTTPLIVLCLSGDGEWGGFIAALLLGALLAAEAGAALGCWWYAWTWSGTLAREP